MLSRLVAAGLVAAGLCQGARAAPLAYGPTPRGLVNSQGRMEPLRQAAATPATPASNDWCPVGTDFVQWLEQRHGLARRPWPPPPARAHGAGPNITLSPSGVVIMEDDGSLLRRDRRPDLEGLTLTFTPAGEDWTLARTPLTYEPDVGTQIFTDRRGFHSQAIALTGFTFPFGGVDRTNLWVTSTMVVGMSDPPAPGPAQLHLADLMADPTLRLAPFQQGTSLHAWNAFFREFPDRAVITWRASDGGFDLDVQAVLWDDGRIHFNYARLLNVGYGAVAVVDGDPAWWADRVSGGSGTSPGGEVALPPPNGPAIDILEVRAIQVGGSEMLDVEIEFEAPLPATTGGTLQFAVELRDEPGSEVVSTIWGEWQDGRWNWTNHPLEVVGSTLRFRLMRSDLPLTDHDVEALAWSAMDWGWHQAVPAMLSWPRRPPSPMLRDLSSTAGLVRGPVFEPFTLGELLPYSVHAAFDEHFGSPRIDGLAIYQNFNTDIVFYAGAYSTVGNAGADGIGAGNSVDPESPALLHMNTLRYGWNSWDGGKVTVLNHEFGHHWLYFIEIMEAGVPTRILGDGHPAGWVHTPAAAVVSNPLDASCMGGSTWRDNADGTFTSPPDFVSIGYSWHDLYLMGLADASEVDDWFYLRDSMPGLPGAYWPAPDLTVSATRVDVTIDQVIAAEGPRVPDRSGSRKDFLVPMVLIVRPGEYTQDDVDEVTRTCQVWMPGFATATDGRGSVRCDRVGFRPPEVAITEPPRDLEIIEGTTLDFVGTASDWDGDAVTLTWEMAGVAPDTTGAGPHALTFDQPGTYRIVLRGVDSTGAVSPPAVRQVRVGCWMPPELDNLRVARPVEGTLRFTWDEPIPEPREYLILWSTWASGGFLAATAGDPGVTWPERPGLMFFRVAGRNPPDCLGPE